MNKTIPHETIKRLALYLRSLRYLARKRVEIISSRKLTEHINASPAQVRKDLACFGEFGVPGVGYQVKKLIAEIESILGLKKKQEVALVGVGKLGSALLAYPGFKRFGFRISALFDNSPEKIGKKISGLKVEDVARIEEVLRRKKIKIAIITVPAANAQEAADRLVAAGIKVILNFAPRYLNIPQGVIINTIDMAIELECLIYYLTR
ncbi:MAG: redox-sensing transcriptional repressor Rex [Candidatus Omnitrophica bacterium]|nr:redox-sensing transcriptional repressor Rex [Candidatus Omnitrophota bacterium]